MRTGILPGDVGKAATVGGHHDEVVIPLLQEDPVHEVACFVIRDRKKRLGHHLDEVLLREIEIHVVRSARKLGVLVGGNAAKLEVDLLRKRSNTQHGRIGLLQLHLAFRERAQDVQELVAEGGRRSFLYRISREGSFRIRPSGRWPGASAHPCPRSAGRWREPKGSSLRI